MRNQHISLNSQSESFNQVGQPPVKISQDAKGPIERLEPVPDSLKATQISLFLTIRTLAQGLHALGLYWSRKYSILNINMIGLTLDAK